MNFLKMCKNEPGQWRSCERKLQKECLRESGEQIEQNDNSNGGEDSEQNREPIKETETGSTSRSRDKPKNLIIVATLVVLIISAPKEVC